MEGDKHLTNVVCTTNESRKEDVMAYRKLFSACAAAAVTVGGFAVVVPPAFGESGPIVVAANPDIVIRRISYADLNLASASAVVTLHRRVGGPVRALGSNRRRFRLLRKISESCLSDVCVGSSPPTDCASGRARTGHRPDRHVTKCPSRDHD